MGAACTQEVTNVGSWTSSVLNEIWIQTLISHLLKEYSNHQAVGSSGWGYFPNLPSEAESLGCNEYKIHGTKRKIIKKEHYSVTELLRHPSGWEKTLILDAVP